MRKLKYENEKLKSQIILPVEKVDREVPNCQFKEECDKCCRNSKVGFNPLWDLYLDLYLHGLYCIVNV